MMRLLTAHKILVGFALALALCLVVWGARHAGQPGAWVALLLGGLAVPAGGLYLRKLYRAPPIR